MVDAQAEVYTNIATLAGLWLNNRTENAVTDMMVDIPINISIQAYNFAMIFGTILPSGI